MKFSHKYLKMPVSLLGTRVLEVFCVDDKHSLSKEFLEYDTTTINHDHYNLPGGKLIVILLLTGTHLWTTIRSWSFEKELYYIGLRGKLVTINVEVI